MRSRTCIAAFALSSLLTAPGALATPAASREPATLAERIDLTRVTVLDADYTRAAGQRNAHDVAAYDREVAAMLRDEILPYASPDAPAGAAAGGTGAAAPRPPREAGAPAAAVDEEEVAAAALDARIADLAREFLALAGKLDGQSVARKSAIIGALLAISARAQFPATPPSSEKSREARERAGQERRDRRDREAFENLPVK
jgi:hypothetical protein